MWKGPEICSSDSDKCVGVEKCGKCLDRCIFNANMIVENKVIFNAEKCMGCGLCISNCAGKSRMMVERKDYAHDHQVPAEILLGKRR